MTERLQQSREGSADVAGADDANLDLLPPRTAVRPETRMRGRTIISNRNAEVCLAERRRNAVCFGVPLSSPRLLARIFLLSAHALSDRGSDVRSVHSLNAGIE